MMLNSHSFQVRQIRRFISNKRIILYTPNSSNRWVDQHSPFFRSV